jgi:hypothetical protein
MGCVLIGPVDVGLVVGILDNSFRPSSLPFENKNFFATRTAANPERARSGAHGGKHLQRSLRA